MFGIGKKGPTRRRPSGIYNDQPFLCGRHVGSKLCARPATWHALIENPRSLTGLSGASSCDEHKYGIIPVPLDFHPLEAICLEDHIWWKNSVGHRPGFCYHPEEAQKMAEELEQSTRALGRAL